MSNPERHDAAPPAFAVAVRGYDRAQVDAYVARLARLADDAERRAQEAERRASEGRRWTTGEGGAEPTYAELGEEAALILQQAGETATALVRRAEERVEAMTAEAQRRVATMEHEARVALAEAEDFRARAASEAEALRRSAQDDARRDAAALIDEARRTAATERATTDERLVALRRQVVQAEQDRDAAVSQLDWLANQLAESAAKLRSEPEPAQPEGVVTLP